MATLAEWVEGARPRTLPVSLAPVLAGTGTAAHLGAARPLAAALCGVVALALQVGVNYANDYSDGVRGSDDVRVGPQRLVGSGAAAPATVKAAAFACFGVAAAAGLALVVLTGLWWLLAVGALCILAAWYYTGGKHPYGYAGLGELFVFVFFGLVATCGTTLVQARAVDGATIAAAVGIGALACAVLVANNLRDIPGDSQVGKHTLAVRLGDRGSRAAYLGLLAAAVVAVLVVAAATGPLALLGLVLVPVAVPAVRAVLRGATGLALIPVLKWTGFAELACGAGLLVGLLLTGR